MKMKAILPAIFILAFICAAGILFPMEAGDTTLTAPTPAAAQETGGKPFTPVPTSTPAPLPTSAPVPAPTPTPAEVMVEKLLQSMTLEEKVGQMFLLSCPGGEQAFTAISAYRPSGFVLFGRDVKKETKESLRAKIDGYQALSVLPMLMAIDEEGGTVNRLSFYAAFRDQPFQSPQSLYAQGGIDSILSDLKEKADLLHSLGINVNLAPVADVSTDPDDFIFYRALGQDAETTAAYISQVVAASKELRLGTTLKHFPGYGNNADTHGGTVVDHRSLQTLQNADLLPFAAGIRAGADSVLVSHNIISCIDPEAPASFSAPVHTLLRETLAFGGVIMTDDLTMEAARAYGDWNTNAVEAILAGNDLVLCSNYDTQIPATIQAARDGRISMEQIDKSVRRILSWKINLEIIKPPS